ncbi:MAG: bifunctional methylenetetrahydrofolate dehydrogenase/methenyltetrahydrofolate cyclohydrolase FolD [Oscillospiraceae bacterium]|nr:bifunctional methylenetetrahydrofolate dehydrogenase/methenyltetrahydrofolate cyclohydrolase FolD [Oscillospiraceae bacterium]
MGKIIDGKAVREYNLDKISERVAALKEKGVQPALAVIIVGSDPASRIYVNNKKNACERTGMRSLEFALPEETTTEELLELIDRLNADKSVNGILCQLPVPKHIDKNAVLERILPEKDVDCFHPENVGRLSIGSGSLVPCTPMGMVKLLEYEGVDPTGKHCVIIGRSDIVGKPMAMLMLARNATVTVCHSKTRNLAEITNQADILVAAVGIPKFVKADMVKQGAVVLDVGMDRDENGKLCGDVDFEAVKEKASLITPVPGGVGPMTIAMLMRNTLTAAEIQNNI